MCVSYDEYTDPIDFGRDRTSNLMKIWKCGEIVIFWDMFACKHAKSNMPSEIKFTLGMYVTYGEFMIHIVLKKGQRSSEVNKGQTL